MQITGACKATGQMLRTKAANTQKSYSTLRPDGPNRPSVSLTKTRLVLCLPVQREVAAPDGVMIRQFIALNHFPVLTAVGTEIKELDLEAFLPCLSPLILSV